MKPRLSVLCLLTLPALLAGCSEEAIAPDTTPPLAPSLQGATFEAGLLGAWWDPNTEPDLAGYNVYVVQNGQTWIANLHPITDSFVALHVEDPNEPVSVFVTAIDVSTNESSPSATRRAIERGPGDERQLGDGYTETTLQ